MYKAPQCHMHQFGFWVIKHELPSVDVIFNQSFHHFHLLTQFPSDWAIICICWSYQFPHICLRIECKIISGNISCQIIWGNISCNTFFFFTLPYTFYPILGELFTFYHPTNGWQPYTFILYCIVSAAELECKCFAMSYFVTLGHPRLLLQSIVWHCNCIPS